MLSKKKEIIYLDILRIFACFMVIINHTSGFILENKTFSNVTFYCLMFSLCKVGVALFLMITGGLVLDKSYSYKKIFRCILRVFVPVLSLSFILYIKDIGIHNINIIGFLKSLLVTPYLLPYWYVYALIGIYLVLPFIQKMVRNFTNQDYAIFTFIFLVVPTFINLLKSYLNFNTNYYLTLAFFPIIITIVVCGNYISKIKLSKKIFISSILLFIISYVSMFLSMYFPYLTREEISYTLDAWNSFPIMLMSISLFYITRYLFENKHYSKKFIDTITTISSTTFGIYLIHAILHFKLYKLGIIQSIFKFNSILAVIVLALIIFIVCMIITYLLKKIPFIKTFL